MKIKYLVILFVLTIVCGCKGTRGSYDRLEVSEKNGRLRVVDKESGFIFSVSKEADDVKVGDISFYFEKKISTMTLKKDLNGYLGSEFFVLGKSGSNVFFDNQHRDGVWDFTHSSIDSQ